MSLLPWSIAPKPDGAPLKPVPRWVWAVLAVPMIPTLLFAMLFLGVNLWLAISRPTLASAELRIHEAEAALARSPKAVTRVSNLYDCDFEETFVGSFACVIDDDTLFVRLTDDWRHGGWFLIKEKDAAPTSGLAERHLSNDPRELPIEGLLLNKGWRIAYRPGD
jgi:hypothetical protein